MQVLDDFCVAVQFIMRRLVNGHLEMERDMITLVAIAVIRLHTSPVDFKDIAQHTLLVCQFAFVLGGILARSLGAITSDALLSLAAAPWANSWLLHLRCLFGCAFVLGGTGAAVSYSFRVISQGAGLMLAVMAVSDCECGQLCRVSCLILGDAFCAGAQRAWRTALVLLIRPIDMSR